MKQSPQSLIFSLRLSIFCFPDGYYSESHRLVRRGGLKMRGFGLHAGEKKWLIKLRLILKRVSGES